MSDLYMYTQNRFITGNPLQNRTQYAFEMASSALHRQFHEMRTEMTSDVLQLFKANQIGFIRAPTKKRCRSLDPISILGMNLTEMFSIPNLELIEEQKRQTRMERKQRIVKQKAENNQNKIQQKIQQWNPFTIPSVESDPQKTLFVSRLSFKTSEKDLKHEFERYGLIKSVHLVRDAEGNSRGYAFIQFQNKDDFNHAYKNANQRKIGGRRVVVDYQRGRTILKWRPRRFGGGLGNLRLTKQEAKRMEQQHKAKIVRKNQRDSRSRERSRDKKQKRRDQQRDRERDRIDRVDRDRDHRKKDKKEKDRKQKKDKKEKRQRSR